MKKFLKQILCKHEPVDMQTEVYIGNPFIVKTTIQCHDCKKTFAQHPNAVCCYVKHIQADAIAQHLMKYNPEAILKITGDVK